MPGLPEGLLRPAKGGVLLSIRVTPKSSRNAIVGLHGQTDEPVSLQVRVTAQPDKGKANKAAIETLAGALGLPKWRSPVCLSGHNPMPDNVLTLPGQPWPLP